MGQVKLIRKYSYNLTTKSPTSYTHTNSTCALKKNVLSSCRHWKYPPTKSHSYSTLLPRPRAQSLLPQICGQRSTTDIPLHEEYKLTYLHFPVSPALPSQYSRCSNSARRYIRTHVMCGTKCLRSKQLKHQ